MNGIGRRQRATLQLMQRNGGIWPQHWRITYPQQRILDQLQARGIITHRDGTYRFNIP
jgi:hypothetical protein